MGNTTKKEDLPNGRAVFIIRNNKGEVITKYTVDSHEKLLYTENQYGDIAVNNTIKN